MGAEASYGIAKSIPGISSGIKAFSKEVSKAFKKGESVELLEGPVAGDNIGVNLRPIPESSTRTPLGFKNAEQWKQCTDELKVALAKSGVEYESIQVRGSSATGISSKGDGTFRMESVDGLKASDIDVGIELKSTSGISTSNNQPGFIHYNKMMKNYPELKEWSAKWTEILGRDITPGGWQPGTLPKDQTNIIVP